MRRERARRSGALLAAALGLLAIGSAAGCGDDIPFDQLTPITGLYNLTTVDGESLPIVVDDGGGTGPQVELIAGILLLGTDENFTIATDFRVTDGSGVTFRSESVTGDWTAGEETGTTVTFLPESEGVEDFSGVASSERMTLSFEGGTWVLDR